MTYSRLQTEMADWNQALISPVLCLTLGQFLLLHLYKPNKLTGPLFNSLETFENYSSSDYQCGPCTISIITWELKKVHSWLHGTYSMGTLEMDQKSVLTCLKPQTFSILKECSHYTFSNCQVSLNTFLLKL